MTEKELVQVVTELVKQGGTIAIWGLIAYQLLAIIKSSIIWIFAFGIVQTITHAIRDLIKWGIENDLKDIRKSLSKT